MNRISVAIICCTLLLEINLSSSFGQEVRKYVPPLVQHHAHFAEYGRVDNYAQLIKMVPTDSINAAKDLANGNYDKAREELQLAVRRHPDSLSLFVALAQDTPTSWESQIQEYEKRQFSSLSREDQFKYATLLFYRWGIYGGDDSKAKQASFILLDLWKQNHDPTIGLMLASALDHCNVNIKGLSHIVIYDALIRDLGGEKVFDKFQSDRKNWFNQAPPNVDLVPAKNRTALENIVHCYWGLSMQRWGYGKMVNGVITPLPPEPYTTYELAAQKYYGKWSENLISAAH
jgi:hypothetical protein